MTVLGKRVEISLENILLATDFTPAAEKASLYAKALAHRYASKVRLVHVVDLTPAFQAPDAAVCMNAFRREGADSLENLKSQFISGGATVQMALREGINPAMEVLDIANRDSVDLIVTGTRGHGGLSRFIFGSFTEQLIHHAKCPVLIVGPDTSPPEPSGVFRRIVYATDFSPEATKAAAFALSFAQDSGAHIYLCHVLPESTHLRRINEQELMTNYTAALQRLIPDLVREWCEPECVLEHGYAADGVLLLANRVKADLIVLGARRFSHWFDRLKSGIAFEVIRKAACPVLTVCG